MASVNAARNKRAVRIRQKAVREGGSNEAAWLFPQQRVLPGPHRAEPEGAHDRTPAASLTQGRAMRAGFSRDPSQSAVPAKGSAAPRQGARVRDGARVRYPSGAEFEGAGAAAATRPARG